MFAEFGPDNPRHKVPMDDPTTLHDPIGSITQFFGRLRAGDPAATALRHQNVCPVYEVGE